MQQLVLFGVVGLVAQLVDGGLGMGYGATSTTLLLASGFAPAAASATVHVAELGSTLASGAAHARFGNVDWRTVRLLAIPGALGAFAGAWTLSALPLRAAAPWTSTILLGLGVFILVRFARGLPPARSAVPLRGRALAPLGAVAGFLDAAGGGGWGPVGTPVLLASGAMEPRRVVGSVNAAEPLVALGASAGFVLALGWEVVASPLVLALFLGGAAAAPIAAWVVHVVPERVLGVVVSGMILATNSRVFVAAFQLSPHARTLAYALTAAAWLTGAAYAWSRAPRAYPPGPAAGARLASSSSTSLRRSTLPTIVSGSSLRNS